MPAVAFPRRHADGFPKVLARSALASAPATTAWADLAVLDIHLGYTMKLGTEIGFRLIHREGHFSRANSSSSAPKSTGFTW